MKTLNRYRLSIVSGLGAALSLGFAAVAGATTDPVLTTASNQVTTYFTSNLTVAIGAFVTVCGVLWLLSLIFKSVGIHRRRSVG